MAKRQTNLSQTWLAAFCLLLLRIPWFRRAVHYLIAVERDHQNAMTLAAWDR